MKPRFGFCFRPALGRNALAGQVLLWVNHRGATCFVARYDIESHEWDALSGSIVPPEGDDRRARQLGRFSLGMKRDLRKMNALVGRLDPQQRYSARHIVDMWLEHTA
jgi:hypothetical protein